MNAILCKEAGKVDKQICLLGYKGELLTFLCPSLKDIRSIEEEYLPHPVIEDQKVTIDFSENLTAATLFQSLFNMDMQSQQVSNPVLNRFFDEENISRFEDISDSQQHTFMTFNFGRTTSRPHKLVGNFAPRPDTNLEYSKPINTDKTSWFTHSNLTFQEPPQEHNEDTHIHQSQQVPTEKTGMTKRGQDAKSNIESSFDQPASRIQTLKASQKPTSSDCITLQKHVWPATETPRQLDRSSRVADMLAASQNSSTGLKSHKAHVDFPKRPLRSAILQSLEQSLHLLLNHPSVRSPPASTLSCPQHLTSSSVSGAHLRQQKALPKSSNQQQKPTATVQPSPPCTNEVWSSLLITERTRSEVFIPPRSFMLQHEHKADSRSELPQQNIRTEQYARFEEFVLRTPASVHLSGEDSEKMSELMSIDTYRAALQAEYAEIDTALIGSEGFEATKEMRSYYGPSNRHISVHPSSNSHINIKDSLKPKRGSLDGLTMQIHQLNLERSKPNGQETIVIRQEEPEMNSSSDIDANKAIEQNTIIKSKDLELDQTKLESLIVIPPNLRKFSDWTGYDMHGLEDFRRPSSITTDEVQNPEEEKIPFSELPDHRLHDHRFSQESKPINCLLTPLLEYKPRNSKESHLPLTTNTAPLQLPKDFRRQQWSSQEKIPSPELKPTKPRLLSFQNYLGLEEDNVCDYVEKEEREIDLPRVPSKEKSKHSEDSYIALAVSVVNVDPTKVVIDHHPGLMAQKPRVEQAPKSNKQEFTADQWLRWMEHQKLHQAKRNLQEFDSADSNYNSDYFYEKCPELFLSYYPAQKEVHQKKYSPGQLPSLDLSKLQTGPSSQHK